MRGEKSGLELLDRLNGIRHQLMHRTTPETIDVSIAAMVMIGLLKHVEARYGRKGAEETWSESAAANDVVAAIRYSRIHEYGRMIELFLQHKYPGKILAYCPACAVRAVADRSEERRVGKEWSSRWLRSH